MADPPPGRASGVRLLPRSEFPKFLGAIRAAGFRIAGPTIRGGAIVYDEIRGEEELPIGWTDRQEAGRYRLERRADAAMFGFTVGPHSWKRYLYPAHERLWAATRDGDSFRVDAPVHAQERWAFLGVRGCELRAIEIQDRVFLGAHPDPGYAARRRSSLLVAIECGEAGATCFCTSMGTGPDVRSGFDLALTELLDGGTHRFLVRAASAAGAEILEGLELAEASGADRIAGADRVASAARSMGRTMRTVGLRDLLVGAAEHPRWEEVATRCLSCANCTLACPTCFCSTTEEVPSLDGEKVERWRRWDSCFNASFSELHGTSVRASGKSRYRQWLTHKLATWFDQFGSSGCVGCGRCITWCPVGIDLTEEVAALAVRPPTPSPPSAP